MNKYHNIINWKSYYKDEQIKDYNLRNTYCINLFNTNDINMEGDNQINYLNPYLGELPMMYYIWKNNLKSEYIMISQYRRDITYIDYKQINKNKIQLIYAWEEDKGIKLKDRILSERDPSGIIKEKLWKFLQKKYSLSKEDIKTIQNKTKYKCMACFVWCMKWEVYCKLCEFIFGFLGELFPNNQWRNINSLLQFRDSQKKIYYELNKDKEDWIYDNKRFVVYIIEDTLSVILGQFIDFFNNNKYWDETFIYTEIDKNIDIKDLCKFYKLNIKVNPMNIYVKCLDDESYKKIKIYLTTHEWEYIRMQVFDKNNEINCNLIKLNINEYIDVDEPINFYYNKYNIKLIK